MLINPISYDHASLPHTAEVEGDGDELAPIILVIDYPARTDECSGRPLSGAMGTQYFAYFKQLGMKRSHFRVECICENFIVGGSFYTLPEHERVYWRSKATERLNKLISNGSAKIVIPAGEEALRLLTGKSGLSKWHLSPLKTTDYFGSVRAIPLLSPHLCMKVFTNLIYISVGAKKVYEYWKFPKEIRKRNFLVRPTLAQVEFYVKEQLANPPKLLALDIETCNNQISCIGFSHDPMEAICIQTLPTDWDMLSFHRIWELINELCGSFIPKTNQNILYDSTYLNVYGLKVINITHDTMSACKWLYPELAKGLDNVARLTIDEPYWKSDHKNWTLKQDMDELYYYNCKDASHTLEIAFKQIQDLKERNELETFQSLIMDMWAPITEMCWTGLPVNKEKLQDLRNKTEEEIHLYTIMLNKESLKFLDKTINPRSPKQVKELLKAAGFKQLPMKNGKETSDYKALCKLKLKEPDSTLIEALMQLSKAQKLLSSYLNYKYNEESSRMFFNLINCSTETGRLAGGTSSFDEGINVQTMPRSGDFRGQFGYE